MKFIFKGLILLLMIGISAGSNNKVENLQKFLQSGDGLTLQIEISQKQFNHQSIMRGVVEIAGIDKYLFDSENETILTQGSTIKTWNKQTRQLLLDEIIEGEFNLFQLLTGNFKGVEFTDFSPHGNKIKVNFKIEAMGFIGYIIFDSRTGRPYELSVNYSRDQSFKVLISAVSPLQSINLYNSFNPPALEVIDLRE